MKSNRILQVILLVIVVVFVAMAGWLYSANSNEVKRQNKLTAEINQNQNTLNQGLAAKAAQQKQATTLQNELTAAKTALSQIHFQTSAESIEYDRILFSIAADNKLQITGLNATPPADIKENNNTYQMTTFTVNVKGLSPSAIFTKTTESAAYISAVVDNILAFTHEVANSSDFSTAVIPSVNITEPQPMTDADIVAQNDSIFNAVRAGLTADEIQDLTDDQIVALVKSKLAAMKPPEVLALIDQANISSPSATITIQVWTYKGA